ncbi:MAG: hypothetical protein GX357_04155 [Firmicutes bacterium]|nr:hypothetical protein [Bacillota bacterium]
MRKPVTLLLALVITLAMALPGFAADYRQAAIDFLVEKHGVPAEHVHLYEGGKIVLEYLQESFWCAKYEITEVDPTQPVLSQPPGSIEPALPQVTPVPEPDLPEDLPSPEYGEDPDTPVSNAPRFDANAFPAQPNSGAIYIREKTGEILDDADTPLYQDEEGGGSMPAYGGSAGEPARHLPVIEEDYEAYHQELEAIRLAGLEASAGIITERLSDLGLNYTYEYGVITAELTKTEINDFATLDAVGLISDDRVYALEAELAQTNSVDDTAVVLDGAAPPVIPISEKNTPPLYFLVFAIPLLGIVYWLLRRHSAGKL